jgi:hypothetical protein
LDDDVIVEHHTSLIREMVDGLVGEDPPGQPYPYPPLAV